MNQPSESVLRIAQSIPEPDVNLVIILIDIFLARNPDQGVVLSTCAAFLLCQMSKLSPDTQISLIDALAHRMRQAVRS